MANTENKYIRQREDIEWSIHYAYDMNRPSLPRILLIGDSICNGYQSFVREKLSKTANISFWASSKCVTDPMYLRELDFILDYTSYDVIAFNNGLHSLTTDFPAWHCAYKCIISHISERLPSAKLLLTLSTPLKDAQLTGICTRLNNAVHTLAAEKSLPVIDLFTPMDALDRGLFWTDTYHFTDAAKSQQADIISARIIDIIHQNNPV